MLMSSAGVNCACWQRKASGRYVYERDILWRIRGMDAKEVGERSLGSLLVCVTLERTMTLFRMNDVHQGI